MSMNNTSQKSTRRTGFTIVEMMVTIGVLVVVAAGVSAIFTSIGDTVSKGRKISELNRFASQVERVMREDLRT
ncbi:MAG: prepilin-type N-terminal cleavage/methylation domain-containing protein [Phycisphaerales bacterium]|nr:prepilin-type N-terminal cleavage/methylation domain-containing protein [Phycisphaerales bacterium]